MSDLDRADVERFADVVQRFESALNRVGPAQSPVTGQSNVNVNAGGIAMWIAATCCCAMLVALWVGSLWVVDHGQRISNLEAYLTAIYTQAPYLKPPEKK